MIASWILFRLFLTHHIFLGVSPYSVCLRLYKISTWTTERVTKPLLNKGRLTLVCRIYAIIPIWFKIRIRSPNSSVLKLHMLRILCRDCNISSFCNQDAIYKFQEETAIVGCSQYWSELLDSQIPNGWRFGRKYIRKESWSCTVPFKLQISL